MTSSINPEKPLLKTNPVFGIKFQEVPTQNSVSSICKPSLKPSFIDINENSVSTNIGAPSLNLKYHDGNRSGHVTLQNSFITFDHQKSIERKHIHLDLGLHLNISQLEHSQSHEQACYAQTDRIDRQPLKIINKGRKKRKGKKSDISVIDTCAIESERKALMTRGRELMLQGPSCRPSTIDGSGAKRRIKVVAKQVEQSEDCEKPEVSSMGMKQT